MKIAHLSTPLSWRGGEQQIAYLLEGLVEQGVDTQVLCPKGAALETYCLRKEIPVHVHPKTSVFDPRWIWWLRQFLKKSEPDVLHIHDSGAHTLAVLATQRMKTPPHLVLHRRNPIPIKRKAFAQYKYNYRSIKRIICISESVKKAMMPGLKNHGHIRIVYSGIEPEKFTKQQTSVDLRAALGLAPSTILIGNVAALSPQKNPTFWLDLSQYFANRKEIQWVWIGGGNMEEQIREIVQQQGWDHVHLLGFRQDVGDLLPQLDLFCFPSIFEGLGTSVLDAMAAGVPVLASAVGGIPEYLHHRQNGWLFDLGEDKGPAKTGIEFILTHPEEVQKWVATAKHTAQEFHFRHMVTGVMRVYEELLQKE